MRLQSERVLEGQAHPGLRYRGDIDGLRGIAVTLVVLFHLPTGRVPGGYIGVDVFFVLSGFLITGIILHEMEIGRFTLRGFYERRLRRIAPALLAMLAVTTLAAMRYLLPVDLVSYGLSLEAALASVSNFFFLRQEGYFQTTTIWMLQHTWSLAVEEQFYLVFPLAMILLRRFATPVDAAGKKTLPWLPLILAAASLCSLAYAIWLVPRNQTAAFYLPWSRAWELLVGALAAVAPGVRLPSILRSVISGAAVGVVLWCAHVYTAMTAFPGLSALPPCLATVAIILACKEDTPVKRLLAWWPLRGTGLISYSVYLWHWPLLMLHRLGVLPGFAGRSESFAKAVLFVTSYGFGYVSWRVVEQPFRKRGSGAMPALTLGVCSGAVALLLAGIATFCVISRGIPGRFSARAVALAAYQGRMEDYGGRCFVMTGESMDRFDRQSCLSIAPGHRNYLLTGDSHAAALQYGLRHAFPHVHFLQATASACDPLPEVIPDARCGGMRNLVYHHFLADKPAIDGVIVSMRSIMDHGGYATAMQQVDALNTTVSLLKSLGIPVILIGPVQEYDAPLPVLLAYADARNDPQLPAAHVMDGYAAIDGYLKTKADQWGVPYVSMLRVQCPGGRCSVFADDAETIPALEDSHHLTNATSLRLMEILRDRGDLRLE